MATSLKQDLVTLRAKKRKSEVASKRSKELGKDFKQYQARVLERMERDDVEALKSGGTMFSPTSTIYAAINDRSEFVRWAVSESEPIVDLCDEWVGAGTGQTFDEQHALFKAALLAAISETPYIQIKEHSDPLNAMVRERLDDNIPLPPGVTFRTDNYVSQRNG